MWIQPIGFLRFHQRVNNGAGFRTFYGIRKQPVFCPTAKGRMALSVKGSFGCLSVLCGRVEGLRGGHQGGLSPQPGVAVHRPSDPFLHPICDYKAIKPLMADLKKVYTAVTEDEALKNLMMFKEKWSKQYPSCVKSWEDNWNILSTFFAYSTEIRKIIYTTNIIEGLNRQFRQITKNKPSFTNDDSLHKMLYLASRKIVEHWTARSQNWDTVLAQFQLMFQNRQTA